MQLVFVHFSPSGCYCFFVILSVFYPFDEKTSEIISCINSVYIYIYIYIYMCVCVCRCRCRFVRVGECGCECV